MAVNFRLEYRSGLTYTALFPVTNIEAVTDSNFLRYSTIASVSIPVPDGSPTTQTIAIQTTAAQVAANVRMELETGEQDDYNTIVQFEIQENQLILTRLYEWPTNAITVNLIFEERGN